MPAGVFWKSAFHEPVLPVWLIKLLLLSAVAVPPLAGAEPALPVMLIDAVPDKLAVR